MKVLLTGAAGSLGSATLPLLREAGHEVVATDKQMSRWAEPDIEIADLCDMQAVYRMLKGVDVVVHVGNVPNDAPSFEQTYISNLTANAAIFYGAVNRKVQRVIWASTIQVCSGKTSDHESGPPIAYLPADGELPGIPQNTYALGKYLSEQTLESLCQWHGIEGVAVRFPWLLREDYLRYSKRYSSGKLGQHYGKTLDSLLWLTVTDAARLLVACVQARKLPGYRAYLPAADDLLYDEPLEKIVAEYFPDIPWKVPLAEHGRLNDNSRITAETGWAPRDDRQKIMALVAAMTSQSN